MPHPRSPMAPAFLMAATTFLLVACLASPLTLSASEIVFEVNTAQSRVAFTLPSLLHNTHGTFRVKRGRLRLEPTNGAVSGECVVDATSGNSGNRARDHRMHREILESDRYPEIIFSPTQVRGSVDLQGESQVEVDGIFTIHGASHPLTATAVIRMAGDGFTVATHFLVPYIQWGMHDPSTFVLRVGKQVEIDFEASGRIVR
jgi:polyisoprenoid-binding protein YceI